MEIKPLGTLTAVLYLIDGLISHHQAIMLKERTKRRLGSFLLFFFFFSSIRRHTRLTCDWSSDVCSSDLESGYDLSSARKRLRRLDFVAALAIAFPNPTLLAGQIRTRINRHMIRHHKGRVKAHAELSEDRKSVV